MKKLSEKQRLRTMRRCVRRQRRRLKSKEILHNWTVRVTEQMKKFDSAAGKLPPTSIRPNAEGIPARTMLAPQTLSMTRNLTETLGFIYGARALIWEVRPRLRNWVLDFSKIEFIGPAAALVLAAELDRFSSQVSTRLSPYVDTWQPQVRSMFHDLGFLPFLGLGQYTVVKPEQGQQLRFLRLMSSQATEGFTADRLRQSLEDMSGKKLSAPKAAYAAICEAMTNSIQHAYNSPEAAWPAPYVKKWWATGVFDQQKRSIHFFVYDQGVGIPSTLPKSSVWNQLKTLRLERDDASLIDAAIDARRSSVATVGRGQGLLDVVSIIDQEKQGRLRIISGAGEVIYEPGEKRTRKKLDGNLLGTLIEWEFPTDE